MPTQDRDNAALSRLSGLACAGECDREQDRIVVARSVPEVEAIREVWKNWAWSPNADIDFYLHILGSRPEILRPHVLVLYRNHEPVAMLVGRLVESPVAVRLGYAKLFNTQARSLTFIQGGVAGDLCADNAEKLVWEIIGSLREGEADLADFRFLKTDSSLYRSIVQLPGFLLRDRFPLVQRHWSMKLPEKPEGVSNCISGHERRQIRRRAKQLEADYSGGIRVERFTTIGDGERIFADIEEVARKTYQRGLGVGFFNNRESRERLRFEAEKGWLRVHITYVADSPCAFWMGSLYHGVFHSGDVGYDPAYKKYEIGKQLLVKVLEDLCHEGARQVDFGLGDADWKQRFGDAEWQEASVSIFAPSLRGFGINLCRTPILMIEKAAKRALERTQILARIKKLWRGHAARAQNDGAE
jgi:hypothetical protein